MDTERKKKEKNSYIHAAIALLRVEKRKKGNLTKKYPSYEYTLNQYNKIIYTIYILKYISFNKQSYSVACPIKYFHFLRPTPCQKAIFIQEQPIWLEFSGDVCLSLESL